MGNFNTTDLHRFSYLEKPYTHKKTTVKGRSLRKYTPWIACHCDHVLIYQWAATEWPLYESCCPLPSYFRYRDPPIEILPWVPPILNIVYHIGTHFFPSPQVACHCDHLLIYSWATCMAVLPLWYLRTVG